MGALVTYPEALFEKVVLPGKLAKNIIYLKTNDSIDLDGLREQLVGYGFESTDFVYEPGQFALRGGILDIYSFGNEKPYRLELFGNDIDSIRIFDPETQLSERKLLQVSIIPNVETHFDSSEKISLFEFLPENTVFWMQDRELTLEKLQVQEEDLKLFLKLREEGLVKAEPVELKGKRGGPKDSYMGQEEDEKETKAVILAEDFISASDMERQLRNRHTVEFGPKPAVKNVHYEIPFNTKEQPAFNRRFDLLINDLKTWERKGRGGLGQNSRPPPPPKTP